MSATGVGSLDVSVTPGHLLALGLAARFLVGHVNELNAQAGVPTTSEFHAAAGKVVEAVRRTDTRQEMRHHKRVFHRYPDRVAAGRMLGAELARRRWTDPVVLALPRGGVPVAAEVADALGARLGVVVARKVGAPDQPEFAVGAVTADGACFFDSATLHALGLRRSDLTFEVAEATAEARRRQSDYASAMPEITGRDVLVVDDGLATGLTALAAVHAVRALNPRTVTVAVPVGAAPAVSRLESVADHVYCLRQPEPFRAVGQWYRDFTQVNDDEVHATVGKFTDRETS